MKDWKSHLIMGLLLTVAWVSTLGYFNTLTFSPEAVALLVVATMLASLFPDIDLKSSKIRDMISLVVAAVVSIIYVFFFAETWYYSLPYFLIVYFLLRSIKTKHRGFTHTLKFGAIFSFLVVMIVDFILFLSLRDFVLWFAIILSSYELHLFLDKSYKA